MMTPSALLKVVLSLFIFFGLLIGCSQSEVESSSDSEHPENLLTVAEIYDDCGDTLFAALYNLPVTHQFFEEREDLVAQPAYYISESLQPEEKESILIQLNLFYQRVNSNEERIVLARQLTQWCEAHQTTQVLQQQHGYEEFLASLYESDRFDYLFMPYLNSSMFQSDEYSAFDKAASLSSAQGQHILNILITDLSRQNTQYFKEDLATLKTLL